MITLRNATLWFVVGAGIIVAGVAVFAPGFANGWARASLIAAGLGFAVTAALLAAGPSVLRENLAFVAALIAGTGGLTFILAVVAVIQATSGGRR